MTKTVLNNRVTHDVVRLHTSGPTAARDRLVFTTVLPAGAAAEAGHTNAAGRPRDPRRLVRLLLDADFHFTGLPMPLQRGLLRSRASVAPASIH